MSAFRYQAIGLSGAPEQPLFANGICQLTNQVAFGSHVRC